MSRTTSRSTASCIAGRKTRAAAEKVSSRSPKEASMSRQWKKASSSVWNTGVVIGNLCSRANAALGQANRPKTMRSPNLLHSQLQLYRAD